ncbi:MAG: inositol monophosphatase [Anaerolineae bacterium]|nr:inositol monophosphatase [Anaerolineae bacterium]
MTNTLDTAAALDTAEAIARHAGAVLAEHYQRPRAAHSKSALIDLVTEADGASETLIVAALRAAFPDHHIHGEEGGGYGPAPDETPYHWYVDPLDGTTNFAHRFPIFSVSLSLSGPDLQPILGVVHAPLLGETYRGVRGGGATLNGQRLRVSSVPDLAQALVITGFPYTSWTAEDNNSARFGHFLRRVQSARCGGSAALDLCWVAAGRFDVYWEEGPHPWDVQAGILFVHEAGGTVSDYAGQLSREALSGQRILATNGLVHAQALAVIQHGDGAPRPVPSA